MSTLSMSKLKKKKIVLHIYFTKACAHKKNLKEPRKFRQIWTMMKFPKQTIDRPIIRRAMRVRSFVCKACNKITTNVSQITGWTFTPQGWWVPNHQDQLYGTPATGSMPMITSTLRRTYGRSTSGSLSRLWLHIVQVTANCVFHWLVNSDPIPLIDIAPIVACHSSALSITCYLTFITRDYESVWST